MEVLDGEEMMLKKIWLAVAILISVSALFFAAGCGGRTEYVFKGVIGDEKVEFLIQDRAAPPLTHVLRVEKFDGSKIEYIDRYGGELELDSVVIIISDGSRTEYSLRSPNPAVRNVVAEAQKQFDQYLEKILEIKTSPLRGK